MVRVRAYTHVIHLEFYVLVLFCRSVRIWFGGKVKRFVSRLVFGLVLVLIFVELSERASIFHSFFTHIPFFVNPSL